MNGDKGRRLEDAVPLSTRDLMHMLREQNERHGIEALRHQREIDACHRRSAALEETVMLLRGRLRLWVSLALAMVLSEVVTTARSIFGHFGSWAYKVSMVGFLPGALISWLTVAGLLLIPFLILGSRNANQHLRKTLMGMAATGLGMSMFAFLVMAYVAHPMDAPAAVQSWAVTAVWCGVAMWMIASAVNNEQVMLSRAAVHPVEEGAPCLGK